VRDPVVMNHPAIAGQEDKIVERSAYRGVWYERGWRSTDDPDFTGDPGDPASWLTGEVTNRRLRLARTEGVNTAASGTTVLADLDGSGVVTSVWVAAGTSSAGKDLILAVYVDGEEDPAISVDLGTLFGSHYATSGDWHCDHVQGSANNTALGGTFTFPMPYGDGIRVEIQNPTAGAILTFGQVVYSDEQPPGYRLRSAGSTRLAPDAVAQAATFEFMDIEGAGWLVYNSIAGDGATASTWLERDVEVHIDGEVTPSFAATGLEDWFGGSWYWYGRQFVSSPYAFVAVNDTASTYRTCTAVDLLKWYQGIRFNESVRMVLGTEGNVTTDHTMAWCTLYYLDVRSADPAVDVPPPPIATALDLPGSAGAYVSTPDHASLDIVGDLDLRIDVALDDWTPSANQSLISKYTAGTNMRHWRLYVNSAGALAFTSTPDGATQTTMVSSANLSALANGERRAVRVTMDVDNGAAGRTVTFYTASTLAGSWTQLGTPQVVAGATTLHSGSAILEIGSHSIGVSDLASGTVYAAQVRSGLDGTVVANPDFTGQSASTTSFADSTGKTWTVNGAAAIVALP